MSNTEKKCTSVRWEKSADGSYKLVDQSELVVDLIFHRGLKLNTSLDLGHSTMSLSYNQYKRYCRAVDEDHIMIVAESRRFNWEEDPAYLDLIGGAELLLICDCYLVIIITGDSGEFTASNSQGGYFFEHEFKQGSLKCRISS